MAGAIVEPVIKRAVAFIDGQNLYRHAKDAFGYHYPNYDPHKLHNAVCHARGWTPFGVRFYTGTPSQLRSPMWHGFWAKRLLAMRRSGIFVVDRQIRYRTEEFSLPDGTIYEIDTAQEKGVDVRLAIDIMRLANNNQFDVGVIFSQDQDLAEVSEEIKQISKSSLRWLKLVSAFPSSNTATTKRGINNTDWFKMDKVIYDQCLDAHDYRPSTSISIPNAIPNVRLKERGPF